MAIGQQIKGAMQRARQYWDELTDASGKRAQSAREEREDAVHQRYGGVRTQGERDAEKLFRERQEESQDRGTPDSVMANPAARAARSGQGGQLGGQSRSNAQMQAGRSDTDRPSQSQSQSRAPGQAAPGQAAEAQTSRQYTQQGGSGIQKSLGEQLGAGDQGAAPGANRGRGTPGQRR